MRPTWKCCHAVIGFLVTKKPIEFQPLLEAVNKDIGPAIHHLDKVCAVAPIFFELLGIVIGALVGWIKPTEVKKQVLNDNDFPGDVSFNPLGCCPSDPTKFLVFHTKELQNGCLAMIGAAGIVGQELVIRKEIFVNLGLAEDGFDPTLLPIQF
ncbi:hypothetical protein ACA910_008383 [Epithemia clementina (nom. ined.)]